jgi:catechol-2,3-dioxygenase
MANAKTMRAAFISAGGYHHIGNTWRRRTAPAPDAVRLRITRWCYPIGPLDEVLARVEKAGFPVQTAGSLLVVDPSS